MRLLSSFAHWLHLQWPSGRVEALPLLDDFGRSNVPGLYITGDLTGIPLLKFAVSSGAEAARHIAAELDQLPSHTAKYDLAIIGAGVSGVAAAIEAQKQGLNFVLIESSSTFSTIKNFPKNKPIFLYPEEQTLDETLHLSASMKEDLLVELDEQLSRTDLSVTHANVTSIHRDKKQFQIKMSDHEGVDTSSSLTAYRVIIAIGRSGNYRKLNIPGETLNKVSNRLYDPADYTGKKVVVVGGCDSALETAIACVESKAEVVLSYRGAQIHRAKQENIDRLYELESSKKGSLRIITESEVRVIEEDRILLEHTNPDHPKEEWIENDQVLTMIGRDAPLDFLRTCGIAIHGDWSPLSWVGLIVFFIFCVFIYHWKSYYWFPTDSFNPSVWIDYIYTRVGTSASDKQSLLYTLLQSARGPSFYYTLLYSLCIGYFGFKRIKRRKTPYVRMQTLSLLFFQWIPLFILPEIILPYLGRNGYFHEGTMLRPVADLLFETYDGLLGEERAYWRSYGFILAWPLSVYNFSSASPMWAWIIIGFIQTFILIPLIVYRWGKGAFCSWICSCGALAETLGDTHRHKMPHGPIWNRINFLGQGILLLASTLLLIRIWGWVDQTSWAAQSFDSILQGHSIFTYKWFVDVALAGFFGVGFYFHYSGRLWCRFACPLAALMHIYARFSRFRIFSNKKKCISCNACTAQCHMGIDVMSFASRGLPMEDPQCVRCSACIQVCPTGTLKFGRIGLNQAKVYDLTPASLIHLCEQENANGALN